MRGSIEAILKELEKLHHPEVQVRILQATVGGITTADVTLADASNAVIVGFNVIPDEGARSLADERGVEIRRYDIIYKVTDDIRGTAGRQVEAGRACRGTGACPGAADVHDQPRGYRRRLPCDWRARSNAGVGSASIAMDVGSATIRSIL